MNIILLLIIIINIAYLTLYERKLLAIGQKRIGPNYIGYYGILQPLFDGIKLILNETILPLKSNKLQLILSPL
jgi:NADH:ubiquinone oxidoreductase subunit H